MDALECFAEPGPAWVTIPHRGARHQASLSLEIFPWCETFFFLSCVAFVGFGFVLIVNKLSRMKMCDKFLYTENFINKNKCRGNRKAFLFKTAVRDSS